MNAPNPLQQPATSVASMYRAIVGIGAMCALLIVSVYQATAARIARNQQEFLAGAVSDVLPAAQSTIPVSLDAARKLTEGDASAPLPAFIGFDENGRIAGAVVAAQGMGYQDNIRVLYAYSFELNAITGFRILDSKETPGLGDRVEIEPHFLANFTRLEAALSADGSSLRNPIVTVKQGEKTEAWQIDGITGATITSEAIGDILNSSASAWVPALEADTVRFVADRESGEP